MKKMVISLLALSFLYGQSEDCEVECCEWVDPHYLYIEAFGGANFIPHIEDEGVNYSFHTGYAFWGSLGYRFWYGFRLEGEYAYRRNAIQSVGFFGGTFPIDDGHYRSSSYMGNLIWEMPLDRWFRRCLGIKPILGAGIGYDDQHINGDMGILSFDIVEKGFAWQVMGGLAYSLCNCLDISVDYKCHKGGIHNLYNHTIGLALNYHFYNW